MGFGSVSVKGTSAHVPVTVRNTGHTPLVLQLTWLGVEPERVSGLALLELPPGATEQVAYVVALPVGMPPGRRQLALQVQVQGNDRSRRVFPCEVTVVAAEDVRLWVQHGQGRRRSRFELHVCNRSEQPFQLGLEARTEAPVTVGLRHQEVEVPPGGEVTVPGWVRTRRTSRTGRYLVELRAIGAGAVTTTSFGCQAPPLFPVAGRKVLTLVGVVTVWAGLMVGHWR